MTYTKQQLEAMSDFEVNKALAEKVSAGSNVQRSLPNYDDVTIFGETSIRIMVNYCNNWSDIMPLAVEHGVYYYNGTAFQTIEDYIDGAIIYSDPYYFNTKSPQRAIACCLLMMEI